MPYGGRAAAFRVDRKGRLAYARKGLASGQPANISKGRINPGINAGRDSALRADRRRQVWQDSPSSVVRIPVKCCRIPRQVHKILHWSTRRANFRATRSSLSVEKSLSPLFRETAGHFPPGWLKRMLRSVSTSTATSRPNSKSPLTAAMIPRLLAYCAMSWPHAGQMPCIRWPFRPPCTRVLFAP